MSALAENTADLEAAPRRRIQMPSRRTLLVCSIALIAALGGVVWILSPPSSESTDDAYVGADATEVAPRIRGFVTAVYVADNQSVKAADRLVQIDSEEFDSRVAGAQATLSDALSGVESAKAALTALTAEEKLADAQIVAARTTIRSATAQSNRADADHKRYAALVATGAVARSDADSFAAAAVTAEQDAAKANAMLSVAIESAAVVHAKRPGLVASLQTSEAKVSRAHADLDLAQQDKGHTTIVAPIDGVVGNRLVRVGDYVQPGSRLLTLVPLQALYVTANFKETQTGRMRVGQPVLIEPDALPGVKLHGTVESLAPGSGSSFSLLPFEPGTGNFTKIVQRVGVRIHFDPNQPLVLNLRPGLSVTAKVRLKPAD